MKKFVLFQLILALLFSSIFTISCSDDDDDDDSGNVTPKSEPTPGPLALDISDINFDSSTLILTAKTAAPAGLSVVARCNDKSSVATVTKGGGGLFRFIKLR